MPGKADKTVVANLQTTCALLAHIAGQYQVDVKQLKGMDLDWLKCRFKKFYHASEDHLRIFIERLIYLGEDPEYSAGTVSGAASVSDLLKRAGEMTEDAFDQLCAFRTQAWNTRADGIPDLYEHAIQELESQYYKIAREIGLIDKLGGESEYIASRLEDGE